MRPRSSLLPLQVAAVAVSFLMVSAIAEAQDATGSATPATGVVLTKLSPPVYPPLARQARIMGDVTVQVLIRKDGSVASAEVISGHPMLKQAALDSAQKSQFECRGCNDEVSSYPMTYTFGRLDDGKPREVVTEQPVHSPKCLYLWKCGVGRTSTWQCPENRPSETTESQGHVTILASTVCIQTDTAY